MYRIEFDQMLKGSIAHRHGKPIRQFGVTVDGSTKLVTSGDMVERKTYEALLAAKAIREIAGPDLVVARSERDVGDEEPVGE